MTDVHKLREMCAECEVRIGACAATAIYRTASARATPLAYFPIDFSANIPATVDLRPEAPEIFNQGDVSDCTANAMCGNAQMFLDAVGEACDLSEDFNYFTSRYLMRGNVIPTEDAGSTVYDALLAAQTFGICTAATWVSNDADVEIQPPPAAYAEALKYRVDSFAGLNQYPYDPQNPTTYWFTEDYLFFAIQYILAKGYPIQLGFTACESLETLPAGTIYAGSATSAPIGGHAVVIVGYIMLNVEGVDQLVFIVRNSWGADWGMGGYFYMSAGALYADGLDYWILTSFNGINSVGADQTNALPAPTGASSVNDVIRYWYKILFGREPDVEGEAWWASAMIAYYTEQVTAGAQGSDLAYMKTHTPIAGPDTPTGASSLDDVLAYIYQEYFGHAPDAAGAAWWASSIIAYFRGQFIVGAAARDKAYMAAMGVQV